MKAFVVCLVLAAGALAAPADADVTIATNVGNIFIGRDTLVQGGVTSNLGDIILESAQIHNGRGSAFALPAANPAHAAFVSINAPHQLVIQDQDTVVDTFYSPTSVEVDSTDRTRYAKWQPEAWVQSASYNFAVSAGSGSAALTNEDLIVFRGETRTLNAVDANRWRALIVEDGGTVVFNFERFNFHTVSLGRNAIVKSAVAVGGSALINVNVYSNIRIQKEVYFRAADNNPLCSFASPLGSATGSAYRWFNFQTAVGRVIIEDQSHEVTQACSVHTIPANFVATNNINVGSRVNIIGRLTSSQGSIFVESDSRIAATNFLA